MPRNEDRTLALPEAQLYAVVDASGAEWPAEAAVAVLTEEAPRLRELERAVLADAASGARLEIGAFFEQTFSRASGRLREELAARGESRGTATVAALALIGPFAFVSHAGDSRVYLLRRGELRPLTSDHTLAMVQLRRGEITLEGYQASPFKKTLTQSLGATAALRPDLAELRVIDGDRFLLCSDGLHRLLSDSDIASIFASQPDDAKAAAALIDAANRAGGRDNISAICLSVALDRASLAADMRASARSATSDATPDTARLLRSCFLFASLDDTELLRIAPYFDLQRFEAGEAIFREGDDGDSMAVMIQGKASITFRSAALAELEPGGYAGEISLIRPGRRTATITAREPSAVLSLSRARFHDILARQASLGTRLAIPLMENIAARIVDLRGRLATASATLAERETLHGL
jgi:serine/threonine protein phosphatase PrpC